MVNFPLVNYSLSTHDPTLHSSMMRCRKDTIIGYLNMAECFGLTLSLV